MRFHHSDWFYVLGSIFRQAAFFILAALSLVNNVCLCRLCRSDDKRPNGLTLVPWQSGISLVWDVTVVCPLSDSYVASAAREARSVANSATDLALRSIT